jgi:uncharacterized circularly permuted ATP-grasp superfamily protein/uncharacterized alpha-E superfamily protein
MSDAPLNDNPATPLAPSEWLRTRAAQAPLAHWDELRAQTQGPNDAPTLNPLWRRFAQHWGADGLRSLSPRLQQLQRQVQDNGVTYNVYAHTEQPQRPWALDLFPLLLNCDEWSHIERGVLQRMALLEAIMQDTYGDQTLVQGGLLPTALVQGHPGYVHAMHNSPPVGGRYLSVVAFDLARGPDGLWWLLSQRTQAPSGLGYLLENRLIVSRLFNEAFDALPVHRLASCYQALADGLKARCPCPSGETAHLALLTPGPYNETYFEHAYLARYLGLTLVQGSDLTVRDDKLYLKTLDGLQRVHGLLKRVDDTWLDPLELRADSSLGVPGLLQAVRAGGVLIANAPGSGFLESNAILGFLPALAQELLGEALVLPAIPSWWCGEAAALPDALAHLGEAVIKPTYPANGLRHSFEPVLGQHLSDGERTAWAGHIARDGEAHTVQSWLPLSYQPVWREDASGHAQWESRPAVLRVFAVANAQGDWQVLPGGLARLGTREGIASMQRGGSSADVWAQAPSRAAVDQTSRVHVVDADIGRKPVVTSRSAENLFWVGRYTERTENVLRLTRLGLESLSSEAPSHPPLLQWLDQMARRQGLTSPSAPAAAQSLRLFERNLVASLWDTEHTTGVGFNMNAMLSASSAVRERLSPEHWQLLELTQDEFNQARGSGAWPTTSQALHHMRLTSQRLAAITGAQTDRMNRDDGWRLLSLGRHIERLDFLAQALALALELGVHTQRSGFDAILALFDSTISFHARFQQSRTPQALVEALVTHTDNPRAIVWVAKTLRARLLRLEHLADGATHMLAALVPTTPPTLELWPKGQTQAPALLSLLAQQQHSARQVAEGLSALFFTHSRSAYSVGN